MIFVVLKIETHEHGNMLIEIIECVAECHTFEQALKLGTQIMKDGHDVVFEQKEVA